MAKSDADKKPWEKPSPDADIPPVINFEGGREDMSGIRDTDDHTSLPSGPEPSRLQLVDYVLPDTRHVGKVVPALIIREEDTKDGPRSHLIVFCDGLTDGEEVTLQYRIAERGDTDQPKPGTWR